MSGKPATALESLTRIMGYCSALGLAAIAALMVLDVICRYIFDHPVPGASELIELLMAIVIFAAFPSCTARFEHIRLDYAERCFRDFGRRCFRAMLWLMSSGVIAFLAWRVAITGRTVFEYGDTSSFLRIPLWPFAAFVCLMSVVTALIFLRLAWLELTEQSARRHGGGVAL